MNSNDNGFARVSFCIVSGLEAESLRVPRDYLLWQLI